MGSVNFEEIAARLVQISKAKPLLPETYVPWHIPITLTTLFMPEKMVSLYGHPLWDRLTPQQQIELGRLEMVQVMYSYGWSETLACHFFNRHLLSLNSNTVEYKFLIRELIEEYRHQEMFGMAVEKLERTPVLPTGMHRFFARLTSGYMPAPMVFMSVLSVELLADIYAKHIRKDERIYEVLRKVSELHHIEEGRHILYTEMWLKKYTDQANFFKKTLYSLVVLSNVYFMRTLYVQKAFFEQIGCENPEMYYREARKQHAKQFVDYALGETIDFVRNFDGFNFITRPLWRWIIKANV
jgi:P-aminobenzoate N-oxygenase AurF